MPRLAEQRKKIACATKSLQCFRTWQSTLQRILKINLGIAQHPIDYKYWTTATSPKVPVSNLFKIRTNVYGKETSIIFLILSISKSFQNSRLTWFFSKIEKNVSNNFFFQLPILLHLFHIFLELKWILWILIKLWIYKGCLLCLDGPSGKNDGSSRKKDGPSTKTHKIYILCVFLDSSIVEVKRRNSSVVEVERRTSRRDMSSSQKSRCK
jgi:hypothetical protein